MNTAVVYFSSHHQNTKKIAKVLAGGLKAKLFKFTDAKVNDMKKYDLIGFGSGIYFMKHSQLILDFVDSLPMQKGKKAFIFSTSGSGFDRLAHRDLRKKLVAKSFNVVGEFACRGYDNYGLLRYIGGINKSRPNGKDQANAVKFAKSLIRK